MRSIIGEVEKWKLQEEKEIKRDPSVKTEMKAATGYLEQETH